MKNGKAVEPDGVPAEAWNALGEERINILWMLMKRMMEMDTITENWRQSIPRPINKEKGDIQSCKNYRGIKLICHILNIIERLVDGRLRQEVRLGKQQLRFMKGVGIVDGIFSLRQLMEKCREKQKGISQGHRSLRESTGVQVEMVWSSEKENFRTCSKRSQGNGYAWDSESTRKV